MQRPKNCIGNRIVGLLLGIILLALLPAAGGCSAQPQGNAGESAAEGGRLDVYFFACSEDADSILLRTEDVDIMIDTGVADDSDELVEDMKEIGVEEVDLLILTHPDQDHIGGAARLLEEFPVEEVIQTSCRKGSQLQEELDALLQEENTVVPQQIQELKYGVLELTVYPPEKEEYKSSNNYSIGVLAEYQGISFFFAGDAKKKRLEEFLQRGLPRVDVYKVSHHGRDNGKSDEIIEMLSPKAAVVTAEEPEEKTRRKLDEIGAVWYSTYGKTVHFYVEEQKLHTD